MDRPVTIESNEMIWYIGDNKDCENIESSCGQGNCHWPVQGDHLLTVAVEGGRLGGKRRPKVQEVQMF